MNTTLNVVEIHVKKVPATGRWGIYRVYTEGKNFKEMLWTTSLIRKPAIRMAQAEAKKFGVEIKAEVKYA